MAMGVIVAGWPLRWGGRGEIWNYWPRFPNSVLRLVSICAGNKDKGQRPCNLDAFFGEQQFCDLPPRLAALARSSRMNSK